MSIKIIGKAYRNMSPAAKASIWFVFCNVLQRGISFITTPIFTRVLTSGDYGTYSVFTSWETILLIVVGLNLSAGVFNNGMVDFEHDRDGYTSSMIGLTTVLSLIWLLLYALFRVQINELLNLSSALMVLLLLDCMLKPSMNFWMARQRFEYKYISFAALTIFYAVLNPLLGLWAVSISDDKGTARCVAYALCTIIISAFIYFFLLHKGKIFFNKKYWVYALKFNIPLVPHYLSTVILNQSDKIMISNFCGTSSAGIYSVANSTASVFVLLNSSLTAAFTPWIYTKLHNKNVNGIKEVSNALFLFIGTCSICVTLIAPEIIALMAPEEYSMAIYVIPPLSASVFFMFIYNQVSTVEFFHKKTIFVMMASIVAAGLNVVLNSIFIPIYDFYAAGYTTLACYIVYATLHYANMRHISQKHYGRNLFDSKFLISWSIFILLVTVGISFLYKFIVIRYMTVLVFVLILIWKRNYFLSMIKSIRK